MSSTIYFDHIATTRPHQEVVDVMLPYMREKFANPASLHQGGGRSVRRLKRRGEM